MNTVIRYDLIAKYLGVCACHNTAPAVIPDSFLLQSLLTETISQMKYTTLQYNTINLCLDLFFTFTG